MQTRGQCKASRSFIMLIKVVKRVRSFIMLIISCKASWSFIMLIKVVKRVRSFIMLIKVVKRVRSFIMLIKVVKRVRSFIMLIKVLKRVSTKELSGWLAAGTKSRYKKSNHLKKVPIGVLYPKSRNYTTSVQITSIDKMDQESANHHYVFSREHLLAELTDQGIRYFKRNLLEFSLQPGFNRSHPHFLEFIVDSDDLIILDPGDWRAMNTEEREVAVLGIVLKYLMVNRLENDHMGEDLMKSVRLLDIDPYRVMQVIEECNFLLPKTDHGDSSPASANFHHLIGLDDLEISKITIANGKLFHRDFLYLVAVKYRHYITKAQCYIDKIGPNNYEQGHYTVKLGDDEHIVKCSYGIESEHLVSLTFETNTGNVYGPFQASVR
ncbi:hypothetical protein Btru_033462 [Bulinus truncatus]|nr:hypothetical protein Btru_033462 [Bulinus truncatus]